MEGSLDIIAFFKRLSRSESGSTMAESAAVMPIWVGVLLILRDVFFVGYTWIALQYSVNESVRVGILGATHSANSDTLDDKKADIRDSSRAKLMQTGIRTGILPNSGVNLDQMDTSETYANAVVASLASTDAHAYEDLVTNTTVSVERVTYPGIGPSDWWVTVDGKRTIRASEGKLTGLTNAILWLGLGKTEITLHAQAEGRVEKPLT